MDEKKARKYLLRNNKTERIIFAATPELKAALESLAEDRCISMSALLTELAVDELVDNRELILAGGEEHV